MTATTGLRELRQQASDIIKQAEAGETIIVTINGRPVAQIGPVRRRQWRRVAELGAIFAGPADPDWPADRAHLPDAITDPFAG